MNNIPKVTDKYGNELQCRDMVCFVENPESGSESLVRVLIKALISTKTENYIMYGENNQKVISSKVIKCY